MAPFAVKHFAAAMAGLLVLMSGSARRRGYWDGIPIVVGGTLPQVTCGVALSSHHRFLPADTFIGAATRDCLQGQIAMASASIDIARRHNFHNPLAWYVPSPKYCH